ncbi:MAG: HIT domain-containing protein [Chloroflexota bacterium]|nr:HIT domain-containing protein [Chloroflexota bacterium]
MRGTATSPAGDSGIQPSQRLWTPWRMVYVGGAADPRCVFCNALANEDDAASLIVHRGLHAFVILNLYPYNTGHLMVVPNEHISDLAALSQAARSEMAELTASFCVGLRQVMGCNGLNTGMNLGSAAGAGIADHLHQHIVPRWVGDANFMPIVGGVKVLPELLPATYAKIRAEVGRQKSSADSVRVVLLDPSRSGLFLEHDAFPRVGLTGGETVWKAAMTSLAPIAASCELLGWGGPSSTTFDPIQPPILVLSFTPREGGAPPYRLWSLDDANAALSEGDRAVLAQAVECFD